MSKFIKVKFRDGLYGIRKVSFFSKFGKPEYIDLETPRYVWSLASQYYRACRGTEERVDELLTLLTDPGTPV